MADRILTWYIANFTGTGEEQGPAYYMEDDYEPEGLRLDAEFGPDNGELQVDIKADGVSIMDGPALLTQGETTSDTPGDFVQSAILPAESWVRLHIPASGGAKGISVQLELRRQSDPEP